MSRDITAPVLGAQPQGTMCGVTGSRRRRPPRLAGSRRPTSGPSVSFSTFDFIWAVRASSVWINPFPDSHKSPLYFYSVAINTARWRSGLYLIHLSCVAGWDEVRAPPRARRGKTGGLIRPPLPEIPHVQKKKKKKASFGDASASAPAWPVSPPPPCQVVSVGSASLLELRGRGGPTF